MAKTSARLKRLLSETIDSALSQDTFIRDHETAKQNAYNLAYYRNSNGVIQRITLGSRKGNWEIAHGADIVGLYAFNRTDPLVPDSGGLPGDLFASKNRFFSKDFVTDEEQVTKLLDYITTQVIRDFSQVDTISKFSCVIPTAILSSEEADDINIVSRVFPLGSTCSIGKVFMRQISASLFIGNLDQAKTQSSALIDYLSKKPYDTDYNIGIAESVLQMNSATQKIPALRWRA